MSSTDLGKDEIIELITCALHKTGKLRPINRVRRRVCEHLLGKGLLEALKPADVANLGHYPVIIPSLAPGASVQLTAAGKLAICELPIKAYGDFFPLAADIEHARQKCACAVISARSANEDKPG